MRDPLLNKNFLKILFNSKAQEKYVRLISLDFQERPIEAIEGKAKNEGSLNIDGSSAVRRTCSLSFVLESTEVLGYNWALKNKFQLFIGLKNTIDTINYPEIIWFKQGIFVITSFNQTINSSNSTISIQGKDKMCLLNGELGGHLGYPVDLGVVQDEEGKDQPVLLKDIVFNLLHSYGHESINNIIINDIPDLALELISYKGDLPLYMSGLLDKNSLSDTEPSIIQFEIIGHTLDPDKWGGVKQFYNLSPFADNKDASKIEITEENGESNFYCVLKLQYGDIMGYRPTDMVFPSWNTGALQMAATDHVQTVLDKIIKTFPSYEYFYDIDGRFVFQEKKNYINTTFSPVSSSGVQALADPNAYIWEYLDGELITSFQNTPNLTNLKNDFSVWGIKESTDGKKNPMHYRYIVGEKPSSYIRTDDPDKKAFLSSKVDWRELIWQMADDFSKNNGQGQQFYSALTNLNPWVKNNQTGYENLYADMLGFWRSIYNNGKWDYEVLTNPESLLFWLEFSDPGASINEYGVTKIGHRTKVINDNDAKSIMFRDRINAIFVDPAQVDNVKITAGQSKVIWPAQFNTLVEAAPAQKSLKDSIDSALYDYTYCANNVTISMAPNYLMEPNTVLKISDNINKIFGEYNINKITIPLTVSGTMTVTAVQRTEMIYQGEKGGM